MIEAHKI